MRKESDVFLCSKFILIVFSLVVTPPLLHPILFILASLFKYNQTVSWNVEFIHIYFFCFFSNTFYTWESIKWSFPKGRPLNLCLKSLNNTSVHCLWSPCSLRKKHAFFPKYLIVKWLFRTNFSTYKYYILYKKFWINHSSKRHSNEFVLRSDSIWSYASSKGDTGGARNLYTVNADKVWYVCMPQYFSPFW